MNQILETKERKKNIKTFKIIFLTSTLLLLFSFGIYVSHYFEKSREEKLSKSFAKNYEVYKLYAPSNTPTETQNSSDIIGNIIIPKLNMNYPFFSGISDELLKISPCRFSGEMPNIKSNLCIAGHNYNDDRFFSKISTLENNDLIIIEDLNEKFFYYKVYNKFELNENNLSFVTTSSVNSFELTLITCNNINNKRIAVKAKQ